MLYSVVGWLEGEKKLLQYYSTEELPRLNIFPTVEIVCRKKTEEYFYLDWKYSYIRRLSGNNINLEWNVLNLRRRRNILPEWNGNYRCWRVNEYFFLESNTPQLTMEVYFTRPLLRDWNYPWGIFRVRRRRNVLQHGLTRKEIFFLNWNIQQSTTGIFS